jgi:uncharacterized protein YoxC
VTEEPAATSWKQWKLPQLNLGTLVSVLIAVGFITWQGFMIRGQIDDNSQAVGDMAVAVEGLAGAVGLANELDTRTNILFDEIGSLRDQYQDQADVWIEISTLSERIDVARHEADSLRGDVESTWHQQNELRMEMVERVAEFDLARTTLADLGWKVDDLERRVAEAFGAEMADTGDDYSWQITDLVRQVAELQGRVNASGDTGWEIDEVNRRVDDVSDMVWRLWSALETCNWSHDYLFD